MLETLIGLADKLPNIGTRRSMMVSIMQQSMSILTSSEMKEVLCTDSSHLLKFLLDSVQDSNKLDLLSSFKDAIVNFVGVSRKVEPPVLPEYMWSGASSEPRITYDQLLDLTAFGVLWKDSLPILSSTLKVLLGVYKPEVRATIEKLGADHPLTGLYVMSPYDIMDLTKTKAKPNVVGKFQVDKL